jgi:DNA-binding PadR family transcriptional regulator
MRRSPQSLLPLKDLELRVLLALEAEPLHGYALLTAVAERSPGKLKPGPASLYRTLAKLTENGLLEDAPKSASLGSTDPRRRYFRPTAFGRAVLHAELRRLTALLEEAKAAGIRYGRGVSQ